MSRKKDTYWHGIAKIAIEYGFKPAQVAKIIKSVFPQTDITGRHVGAYKRRLTTDGVITNVLPHSIISLNEMMTMVDDMVTKEDMFVYNCTVGSSIQSLKCFEYKLTAEETDELNKVEVWIRNMKK